MRSIGRETDKKECQHDDGRGGFRLRRLAGYVEEVEHFGASMGQVTVPDHPASAGFVQLFGGSSVYCLTPCTEETATAFAAKHVQGPLTEWDARLMVETYDRYRLQLEDQRRHSIPATAAEQHDDEHSDDAGDDDLHF